MQTFLLGANGDQDSLQFMVDRKQIIDENMEEAVQIEPKKMQLSAEVKSEKPLEDEDATDLTIRVNSKIETVYLGERLTEEAFFMMVDRMLSSLFSFISHGSGWLLKEMNRLNVKLVSYIPIRGSSYPALPSDLQSMNCLFNIRDQENNNCIYCYVGAWHLAYGQSLFENIGSRMKTNPETYSPSSPMTHLPVGDFEIPMAFSQIPRFENLNKVQIIVFLNRKKSHSTANIKTTGITIHLRPSSS